MENIEKTKMVIYGVKLNIVHATAGKIGGQNKLGSLRLRSGEFNGQYYEILRLDLAGLTY